MLTDTHSHLYFDAFDGDRDAVLAQARDAGVARIVVPGVDLETSRAALSLAEAHDEIYAAVGVHPNSGASWSADTLSALRTLAAHPKVVAIGEVGLDYYRRHTPQRQQQHIFGEQLALAAEMKLPVIVHVRNASETARDCIQETLEMLARVSTSLPSGRPGVIHSFSGRLDEANLALAQGFYIGITGPVTFKKADAIRQVAVAIPFDRLLIETDSPFLAPHPHRGRRNQPAYVKYIAEKIAELRGVLPQQVAAMTTENAQRLFQWRSSD